MSHDEPRPGHNHSDDELRTPTFPTYREACPMGCDDTRNRNYYSRPSDRLVSGMSHDEPQTPPDEPQWAKGVSVHEWPTGAWDKVRAEARAALLTELRRKVEALDKRTTTVSGAGRGPLLQAQHDAYAEVLALLHVPEEGAPSE